LEVDFPTVAGGGFLFHDPVQGLYSGAMQLSLYEQITSKALASSPRACPTAAPAIR